MPDNKLKVYRDAWKKLQEEVSDEKTGWGKELLRKGSRTMAKWVVIWFALGLLVLLSGACAPHEIIVIRGQVVSIQTHNGLMYDTTTVTLLSGNTTTVFTFRSSAPLGIGETYTFRMWSVDNDEYVLKSVVQSGAVE